MKKDRRQFLKNTVLATFAIGVSPTLLAKTTSKEALENVNNSDLTDCNELTQDFYGEGPYYTAGAPISNDGMIIPTTEPGTRLRVTGIVKSLDCTEVIPNTIIDIWHANDAGEYDNTGGYHLRKKIITNSAGFYSFETILPGKYPLDPATNDFRPSHIHFKITTPGHTTFTTQLYFQGDTSIPTDLASSITTGSFDATNRIISLTDNAGVLEGTWDIIVDGDGILGASDLHLTNGMIYNVSPNPFIDELTINYGVFKSSNVKIEIYSMQGELVASIEERELKAEKYSIVWKPQSHMASGMYFCVLKINNLQVHYLKILKK